MLPFHMLLIETEREDDGRWLAEVPALPGVLSYGASDTEARSKATALALRAAIALRGGGIASEKGVL